MILVIGNQCEAGSVSSWTQAQPIPWPYFIGMLISYGCYKIVSQTYWLKTNHVYYHTVLEVRNPKLFYWDKIGASKPACLLEAQGKSAFPCLCWPPEAVYISKLVAPSSILKVSGIASSLLYDLCFCLYISLFLSDSLASLL